MISAPSNYGVRQNFPIAIFPVAIWSAETRLVFSGTYLKIPCFVGETCIHKHTRVQHRERGMDKLNFVASSSNFKFFVLAKTSGVLVVPRAMPRHLSLYDGRAHACRQPKTIFNRVLFSDDISPLTGLCAAVNLRSSAAREPAEIVRPRWPWCTWNTQRWSLKMRLNHVEVTKLWWKDVIEFSVSCSWWGCTTLFSTFGRHGEILSAHLEFYCRLCRRGRNNAQRLWRTEPWNPAWPRPQPKSPKNPALIGRT